MRRRAAALAVALLIVLPGWTTDPPGLPAAEGTVLVAEQSVGPFSKRRAMRHVRRLAGRIGPRVAGTGGDRRARRYVRRRFERLGYRTRAPRVPLPQGGRTRNVEAWWPGSTPRVVLGGHLDTVPGSPGANDNASGVAVLLELARILAGTEQALGVRLVAFGAEERQPGGEHHLGSSVYVRTMTRRERRAFELMASVDMIGKPVTIIVGWTVERGPAVRALLRAARRAGVDARAQQIPDVSDHGPFELAGLPAAMLWTGFEPNHHQPTDVVGGVAPRALKASGQLLRELVLRS